MIKATYVGKFSTNQVIKCLKVMQDIDTLKKLGKDLKNEFADIYTVLDIDIHMKLQFKFESDVVSHITFKSIDLNKVEKNNIKLGEL